MKSLFFIDDIQQDYAVLDAEESKHCVKVMRMGLGDTVWVTDGKGTLCRCEISNPDSRACQLRIVERRPDYQQRPFRLHIAVAPAKNNARIEWFIEKAVEIGIDEITPIVCDHSERCLLKEERLEKIAISAMKQSLKAYKPVVHPPVRLKEFLATLSHEGRNERRLICYCDGDERVGLASRYKAGEEALVLIGPEGDFSSQEISAALDAGFQPITLGSCRLRTETAALYAVTALNFMNCQ